LAWRSKKSGCTSTEYSCVAITSLQRYPESYSYTVHTDRRWSTSVSNARWGPPSGRRRGFYLDSDLRPKYANPSHGGPRSTFQLHSLICSTIASGDHVALGIGPWSPALADLETCPQRQSRPAPLKNGTGTEVNPSSPFGQGAGVRWRGGAWESPPRSGTRCRTGKRIMTIATRILSEFLLFSCMFAFVTGVVLAAASLLI
jgi:hypothetical protein